MIEFDQLPDDHPDLPFSPLLRAARLTLTYAADEGPIALTEANELLLACRKNFRIDNTLGISNPP